MQSGVIQASHYDEFAALRFWCYRWYQSLSLKFIVFLDLIEYMSFALLNTLETGNRRIAWAIRSSFLLSICTLSIMFLPNVLLPLQFSWPFSYAFPCLAPIRGNKMLRVVVGWFKSIASVNISLQSGEILQVLLCQCPSQCNTRHIRMLFLFSWSSILFLSGSIVFTWVSMRVFSIYSSVDYVFKAQYLLRFVVSLYLLHRWPLSWSFQSCCMLLRCMLYQCVLLSPIACYVLSCAVRQQILHYRCIPSSSVLFRLLICRATFHFAP